MTHDPLYFLPAVSLHSTQRLRQSTSSPRKRQALLPVIVFVGRGRQKGKGRRRSRATDTDGLSSSQWWTSKQLLPSTISMNWAMKGGTDWVRLTSSMQQASNSCFMFFCASLCSLLDQAVVILGGGAGRGRARGALSPPPLDLLFLFPLSLPLIFSGTDPWGRSRRRSPRLGSDEMNEM